MQKLRRELERLYEKHGAQLFTCALAVTRCRQLAEDAVHEAFSRCFLLTKIPDNLKAYTFRSVRNAAIDQLRRRGKTVSLSEDYVFEPSQNPAEIAEQRQFQRRVAQAFLGLSRNERETIVQHLYAGLTFQEIADLRSRPLGTVATWYRRGLAKLRDYLEQ
jgi:RNA polymerase sigma-70 factor (ECF subfamily)